MDWECHKLKNQAKIDFLFRKKEEEENALKKELDKKKPTGTLLIAKQRITNAPFQIRLRYDEYIYLAKEQSAIHARLRLIKPSERFAACYRIIEIAKIQDQIWDSIRHWSNTNEIISLNIKSKLVLDILENVRRINNINVYISRLKKIINSDKYKGDKIIKYKNKLADLITEKEAIKNKLNL